MGGFHRFLKTTVKALEQLNVEVNNHVQQHQQQQQSSSHHGQHAPTTIPNSSYPGNVAQQHYDNAPYSRIVYPGPDGKLVYPPYNDQGDRILDFSSAGYHEGWNDLPENIPVVMSLDPSGQDDSVRIQQALDHLGTQPLLQGSSFRGALQLNRGHYYISQPLEFRVSGVVLQGDPTGGTIIVGTSDPLTTKCLFKIVGEANEYTKRVPITSEHVPVGGNTITVRDKNHFKIGDSIMVGVAFNEAWVKAVGMDVIHPKGNKDKNNGWKPGRFEHLRRVAAIQPDGKTLILNEPLTASLSKQYGGGFVTKYENKRVQHVGLQFFECQFPQNKDRGPDEMMKSQKKPVKDYRFADEMFNHLMVAMDSAENCWIRRVRSVWWRNFARLGTNTVAVTLQECHHTFPNPPGHVDKRKPIPLTGQFAFELSGQMILIDRCHAEYNFHAYSYKGRIPGPNVVYQSSCIAKNGDVGPHMKWSTGQLYDNCNIEGLMIIQDRFDAGSGHGWSGANSVVWNTVAHAGMVVQKPPTAHNFLMGSSSKRGKARIPQHEWACEESPDKKINPPSLYMTQLHERRQRLQQQ
ncbi:hypothetical protein BDC45DRAFT_558245 [Circinella umbellata]|nr:hypothetical protein BDC45DRAFT_558245 [Circinella umbellata]